MPLSRYFFVPLHTLRDVLVRSGYSSNNQKTESIPLLMAGHTLSGAALQPVDYNDGGHSYLINSRSFHHNHSTSRFLFHQSIKNKYHSMFSGIIEEFATVTNIRHDRENIDLTLTCSFVNELKIDQSVAHNGVCLTVVAIDGNQYTVTAMQETLDRSNLGLLKVGDRVNVERSMLMNGRLDGHIVQGHVDATARCVEMKDADGSTYFTFEYKADKEMAQRGYFTVDKGSVTVNGVSLTVCNPTDNRFSVAIIPYTMEHTNFCDIKVGSTVNLEFDIIGKYVARLSACR